MSDPRITDVLLERYLSGDVPEATRSRIEIALREDIALRARFQELERERALFYASDPPARFAHRVATQVAVAHEQKQAPAGARFRWLFSPALGAVAVVVLVIGVLFVNRERSSVSDSMAPPAPSVVAQEGPRRPEAQEKTQPAPMESPKAEYARAEKAEREPPAKAKKADARDLDDVLSNDKDKKGSTSGLAGTLGDGLAKDVTKKRSDRASDEGGGSAQGRGYAAPPTAAVETPAEKPATKPEPARDRSYAQAPAQPSAQPGAGPAPEAKTALKPAAAEKAPAKEEAADAASSARPTATVLSPPSPAPSRADSGAAAEAEAEAELYQTPSAFAVVRSAGGTKRAPLEGGTFATNASVRLALNVPAGYSYAVLTLDETGLQRVIAAVHKVTTGQRVWADVKPAGTPVVVIVVFSPTGFGLYDLRLGTEAQRKAAFLAPLGFSGTELRIRLVPE